MQISAGSVIIRRPLATQHVPISSFLLFENCYTLLVYLLFRPFDWRVDVSKAQKVQEALASSTGEVRIIVPYFSFILDPFLAKKVLRPRTWFRVDNFNRVFTSTVVSADFNLRFFQRYFVLSFTVKLKTGYMHFSASEASTMTENVGTDNDACFGIRWLVVFIREMSRCLVDGSLNQVCDPWIQIYVGPLVGLLVSVLSVWYLMPEAMKHLPADRDLLVGTHNITTADGQSISPFIWPKRSLANCYTLEKGIA